MPDYLYENRVSYIYEIKDIYDLDNKGCRFLLFNPFVNYWMPLDDIGVEIYLKIKELNSMKKVEEFFCNKYEISSKIFRDDSNELIKCFVKRKLLVENVEKDNWLNNHYELSNDIMKYPFNDIYISLSDNCNLDCIYCFNKEQRKCRLKNKNIKYLTTEKIKEVLLEFKSINGQGVIFTGGEPTLNNDFEELCVYAHSIGLNVSFITNGLLLGKLNFDRLFNSLDTFGISFDSIVNAELEEMWNVKNSRLSDIVLSNLMKVDEWAGENNKIIKINMMPIVSKLNNKSLPKLVEAVTENIKHCEVQWSMTKYDIINKRDIDEKMDISEQKYIDSVANSLIGLASSDMNSVLAYAYGHANKNEPSYKPKVISCAPSYFLTNDGSIYPCQGCEKEQYYIGSIWKINLKDAFETEAFENVKYQIIKDNMYKCKECELRYTCVAEGRPCVEKIEDNCREECVKRMFVYAISN